MAMYVGVNGTPKEISSLYVGVNGVPKECTEVYAGDNGSVKLVAAAKADPGQSIFTSSTVFTIPKGYKEITVFVVGGGGKGHDFEQFSNAFYLDRYYGGGGGGGYTKTTVLNVSGVKSINVNIGAGSSNSIIGSVTAKCGSNGDSIAGGSGGSGGGNADYEASSSSGWNGYTGGRGGSDGSDGSSYTSGNPGKGQGTTTRAFGESNGTLYSGGGGGGNTGSGHQGGNGGGGAGKTSGGINTGGGGGGGCWEKGGSGGSGIAIIRWGY